MAAGSTGGGASTAQTHGSIPEESQGVCALCFLVEQQIKLLTVEFKLRPSVQSSAACSHWNHTDIIGNNVEPPVC